MVTCTLRDLKNVPIKQVINSKIYYRWWQIIWGMVEAGNLFSIFGKWQEDNKLQKWKNPKGQKDRMGLVKTLELKLQSTNRHADLKVNHFNRTHLIESLCAIWNAGNPMKIGGVNNTQRIINICFQCLLIYISPWGIS